MVSQPPSSVRGTKPGSDSTDVATTPVASVKDVAAAAGVSVGTVSHVLNHPERVSPATRDRVQEAMRSLNYVRNESARQLRSGTSRTMAYVVLDTSNPFFADVAAGIDDGASGVDAPVFLCNSAHRIDREAAFLDHLRQQRVLGIMITPVEPDGPLLTEVAAQGVPVVVVDRTRSDDALCSVDADDRIGGRLAVEHLHHQGHHRVAFIGGPMSLGQVRDRLAGARDAWAEAGHPDDTLMVLETSSLTIADGLEAGERWLALALDDRPGAVFCANDLVAIGLLQKAISAGLSVPDDVAIIGYDDIDFAAAAAVPLTSIRQPRHELGRAAVTLLLDEVANPDHTHQHIVFTPELIARRSTTGVDGADDGIDGADGRIGAGS